MTRSPAGPPLAPLYTSAPATDSGWPGQAPWTRGSRSQGAWRIVQAVCDPAPPQAREQALEELAQGADGLLIQVDGGGQGPGVRFARGRDLSDLLLDLPLQGRTLALDAGEDPLAVAAALPWVRGAAWPAGLELHLGADPVGQLLRRGRLPGGTRALGALGDLAAWALAALPGARAVAVDLRALHEGGADPVELLAVALATGLTYLRAMADAGLSEAQALDQLVFRLPVSSQLLQEIGTLRALRRLWGRVGEACGAPEHAGAVIHAFPAARELRRRDPALNLLRGTAMVFSAACAGADLVTTLASDAVEGPGSALGRRQARNCQLILREEASLGRVLDPAGGAYFFESWTEALAQQAWSRFQEIEAQGGVLPALERGLLLPGLLERRQALAAAIATRRSPLTGLSEYAWLGEPAAASPPQAPAAVVDPPAALVIGPLPLPGRGELMATLVAADPLLALRGLSALIEVEAGEIQAEPLLPLRLPAPFEALQDRSDAWLRRQGTRPSVWLACLGGPAEHGARLSFSRNLLAAGGLEARVGQGSQGFDGSGCTVAVLCGDDAAYAREAEALVGALRAAGARQVWLAGKPGALETPLHRAGLTDAFFQGADVLATLERIWTAWEPTT